MRIILALAAVALIASPARAQYGYDSSGYGSSLGSSYGQQPVFVRSHVRSDGAFVPSHFRTRADNTQTNNWSSYPNVNPYTGEMGRRTPRY